MRLKTASLKKCEKLWTLPNRTPEDFCGRRGPVGFFESTGGGVCGWRCNGVWVVPAVQSFSSVHSRRKSVSIDHHATVAFRVCHGVQPTTQANGHLFQNRYKSTVVDDEQYFLALLRYIHLNPVRAKLVEDVRSLKDCAWTGHRVLMGKARMLFQDTDAMLGRFGARAGEARLELVKFMGDEGEREERKLFKGGGLVRSAGGYEALKKMSRDEKWAFDERILGSGSFVESVLKQAEPEMQTPSMIDRGAPSPRIESPWRSVPPDWSPRIEHPDRAPCVRGRSV